MGINASFITQSCTQLNHQLTQKNLLSLDFEKIPTNNTSSQHPQIQLYQHFHTKKVYKLQQFQCSRKDSQLLSKALKNLQFIKNNHICNILFSQVNTKLTNIISKHSEVKIFSEHSTLNFSDFIQKKARQNIEAKNRQLSNQAQSIIFSNIQIANFIHGLFGIASEISSLYLPVKIIDPEDFAILQNQHSKIKYSVRFDQILNKNNNSNLKGYFSPELMRQQKQNQVFFGINQNIWTQNFGMVILHYLLMESSDDCYHYKSGQFCQSQLEKKLIRISELLESRLIDRQESVQIFKQSRASFTSSGRLSTKSNYFQEEEPFQVILYELIMEMLCPEPQKRITVKQIKFRSRKLMQKVHQQVMIKSKTQNSQFISGVFEKAKKQKALFTSPDLSIKDQSFQQSFLLMKKVSSNNQTNTTDSILPESRGKSIIKHLKSKRKSQKEKSFLMDSNSSFIINKENIQSQNNQSGTKDAKRHFRKLSGYRKVMISEHSFMQGFFQNEKAHGLGKITKKNGEIIECIFHNNQIIDAIHPR